MDIEKARQFLTKKGWDKSNPTVGGVFFEGIAELLAEYEAKVIAVQPDVIKSVCLIGYSFEGCTLSEPLTESCKRCDKFK